MIVAISQNSICIDAISRRFATTMADMLCALAGRWYKWNIRKSPTTVLSFKHFGIGPNAQMHRCTDWPWRRATLNRFHDVKVQRVGVSGKLLRSQMLVPIIGTNICTIVVLWKVSPGNFSVSAEEIGPQRWWIWKLEVSAGWSFAVVNWNFKSLSC